MTYKRDFMRGAGAGLLGAFLVLSAAVTVRAERFTSPNFTIDASTIGGSVAGPQSSTNYGLVSSGGESIIGNASGGSYRLGQGFISQLENSIQMSVTPGTLNLGNVTPGTSIDGSLTVDVQTDTPGYTLSVFQDHDLQNGAITIPGVTGSISSPVSWAEGSTKGLGFTLVSTNATAIPGKWSSGGSYAALPASDTAYYSRTGYSGGQTDTLTMRLKLDVVSSQAALNYTNTVTWTGTTTP